MLLSSGVSMSCLLPQDDQLITELPLAANRPPRIIPGLSKPEKRESTVQVDLSCPREPFSVRVDDPNITDELRARWFIDPNERYVADTGQPPAIEGNSGVLLGGGSTVRLVQSNTQFFTQLGAFADGRPHRVEVVITDGSFQENQRPDVNGNLQPFLDVSRPPVRTTSGEVISVEAFRVDYVWLVVADNLRCP